jgi:hypothetical protein
LMCQHPIDSGHEIAAFLYFWHCKENIISKRLFSDTNKQQNKIQTKCESLICFQLYMSYIAMFSNSEEKCGLE